MRLRHFIQLTLLVSAFLSACHDISVTPNLVTPPSPPTPLPVTVSAAISAESWVGEPGNSFTFTANVSVQNSTINELQWTSSDNQSATGETVSFSFPDAGDFDINLVATAQDGTTSSDSVSVSILAPDQFLPTQAEYRGVPVDLDDNEVVDLSDLLALAQAVGNIEGLTSLDVIERADINFDNTVDRQDLRLAAFAIADEAVLPTALLGESMRPGALLTFISPEALSVGADYQVKFSGNDADAAFQTAPGYLNFQVPFDILVDGEPTDIEFFRDGVSIEIVSLTVESAKEIVDPVTEYIQLMDAMLAVYEDNRTAALEQLGANAPEDQRSVIDEIFNNVINAVEDTKTAIEDDPNSEESKYFTELFLSYAYASGADQILPTATNTQSSMTGRISKAPYNNTLFKTPTEVCDILIPNVCEARTFGSALSFVDSVVTYSCDAAAVVILGTTLADSPLPGPADAVAFAIASRFLPACVSISAASLPAVIVADFTKDFSVNYALQASPSSISRNESSTISAPVKINGTEQICLGVGAQGTKALSNIIKRKVVDKLVTKSIGLRAVRRVYQSFGQKSLNSFVTIVENAVGQVVTDNDATQLLIGFAASYCDDLNQPDLFLPVSRIASLPVGDGTLISAGGTRGEASYQCPADPLKQTITLKAEKQLCSSAPTVRTATVNCAVSVVGITIGDNGSLNDDIFEVRIGGKTILTSSSPVRSISVNVPLSAGITTVEMIGRAAPDGIGTYFIRFDGDVRLVSGDPLSGSDLTPGRKKTFIIEVL